LIKPFQNNIPAKLHEFPESYVIQLILPMQYQLTPFYQSWENQADKEPNPKEIAPQQNPNSFMCHI
jgi:hypothetical protein